MSSYRSKRLPAISQRTPSGESFYTLEENEIKSKDEININIQELKNTYNKFPVLNKYIVLDNPVVPGITLVFAITKTKKRYKFFYDNKFIIEGTSTGFKEFNKDVHYVLKHNLLKDKFTLNKKYKNVGKKEVVDNEVIFKSYFTNLGSADVFYILIPKVNCENEIINKSICNNLHEDKENTHVLLNKEPEFIDGKNRLAFIKDNNEVVIPSVKNCQIFEDNKCVFQLIKLARETVYNGENVNNVFSLRVSYPFSPIQAFGLFIAINNKW